MTDKEIVQSLRVCFRDVNHGGDCCNCPAIGDERCMAKVMDGAADLIERLTAERDALLEYAKTMQECEMCKNDTFCHLRDPMEDDCQHCQRASDCPCQKCEENNCWEWRGLPMPEEGEKA